MNNEISSLWLNNKDILPSRKLRLIRHFKSASAVYCASESDYRAAGFLTDNNITRLMQKELAAAEREYLKCAELGIRIIPSSDGAFPPALAQIPDPPVLLYAKGDISLLKNRLAFCLVGSRKCTNYGATQAMHFASRLAEAGFVIVSGGAMGIDSAAHKGALNANGKTIAVLGCGIDVNYPTGNKKLRSDIAEKGLLISEYPLSTPPLSYNFPRRNRILSGLSLGVAVIEAVARSGSLITAGYALAQNRDLYAIPGNIDSVCSSGCNDLIRQGCEILTDPDQIIAEYLPGYAAHFPKAEKGSESQTVKDVLEAAKSSSDDRENAVIRMLRRGEQHIDYIISFLGIPVSEVISLLTVMQIKGLIREEAGQYYTLNQEVNL